MAPVLPDHALGKIRRKARDLLAQLEGTLCIAFQLNRAARTWIDKQSDLVQTGGKKQLRALILSLQDRIRSVRADFRIKAPVSTLLEVLRIVKATPSGRFTWMPLYSFRNLFNDLDGALPSLRGWPAHGRVGLDCSGQLYHDSPSPEAWLLEGLIFEDLAALFNLAKLEHESLPQVPPKVQFKRYKALCRACVMSSVTFVEAYLNGVAFDHLIQNGATLDEATRSMLADWDFNRKRPRYLPLKEKLLQYQRIILNKEHAPLQESNCPEMATLLNLAKTYRDAFAHPSPGLNWASFSPQREAAVLGTGLDLATTAVDASIRLVKKLEVTLTGNTERLFWLYERDSNGLFPDEVFR